jgi:hypothetical protein
VLTEPSLNLAEVVHSACVPDVLGHEGLRWRVVDTLHLGDDESERAHGVEFRDCKESFRVRRLNHYRNKDRLEDTGRAHTGGCIAFHVAQLNPGLPLLILRRVDLVWGDPEFEFFVNARASGKVAAAEADRVHRWRNRPFVIPGERVTTVPLNVQQVACTPDDTYTYRYWFYQPDMGSLSTS